MEFEYLFGIEKCLDVEKLEEKRLALLFSLKLYKPLISDFPKLLFHMGNY